MGSMRGGKPERAIISWPTLEPLTPGHEVPFRFSPHMEHILCAREIRELCHHVRVGVATLVRAALWIAPLIDRILCAGPGITLEVTEAKVRTIKCESEYVRT